MRILKLLKTSKWKITAFSDVIRLNRAAVIDTVDCAFSQEMTLKGNDPMNLFILKLASSYYSKLLSSSIFRV